MCVFGPTKQTLTLAPDFRCETKVRKSCCHSREGGGGGPVWGRRRIEPHLLRLPHPPPSTLEPTLCLLPPPPLSRDERNSCSLSKKGS